MLTYEVMNNYKVEHIEQKDEKIIARFNAVNDKVLTMSDDEADEFIEAVSAVVWDDDTAALEVLKRYKVKKADAVLWYCHEEY